MNNGWFGAVFRLLFPSRCPYCRQVLPKDLPLCERCRESLPKQRSPILIVHKSGTQPTLCTAPFVYQSKVTAALTAFKFQDRPGLAHSFGESMADQVQRTFSGQAFDWVTGVPLAKAKKKERGYNQAELLGRRVACCLEIPYAELLLKPKDTPAQHTLGRSAREENLMGAYRPVGQKPLAGKRILLCDDIVTTGSTLRECCRVLYASGASLVQCAALAAVNNPV